MMIISIIQYFIIEFFNFFVHIHGNFKPLIQIIQINQKKIYLFIFRLQSLMF